MKDDTLPDTADLHDQQHRGIDECLSEAPTTVKGMCAYAPHLRGHPDGLKLCRSIWGHLRQWPAYEIEWQAIDPVTADSSQILRLADEADKADQAWEERPQAPTVSQTQLVEPQVVPAAVIVTPTISPIWVASPSDQFTLAELQTPPPAHEFVFPRYVPVGVHTVIAGAGATSKTGLVIAMEVALCTGGEMLGSRCDRDGATLHLSAEDDRAPVLRSLYANSRHLNDAKLRALKGNFHFKNLVGSGVLLTRYQNGTLDIAPEVDEIIEYALKIPNLRMIVVDTLSRVHGGDEDNPGLSAYVRACEKLAQATGTGIITIHHAGKVQMRAGSNDQYSSRGGTALSDNSRSVLNVTAMSPERDTIPKNGELLAAEGNLLRITHVKSNYGQRVGDQFLERKSTQQAALLAEFRPTWGERGPAGRWDALCGWFASNDEVPYPTSSTIDALDDTWGSRAERRAAVNFAKDRGLLVELPHPSPSGSRKTYLALPNAVAQTPHFDPPWAEAA